MPRPDCEKHRGHSQTGVVKKLWKGAISDLVSFRVAAGAYTLGARARPTGVRDPRAFLCTDFDATPVEILGWFVQSLVHRNDIPGEPRASRRRTQREWSDLAIARKTPALFGLFSLVTLWAADPKIAGSLRRVRPRGITTPNFLQRRHGRRSKALLERAEFINVSARLRTVWNFQPPSAKD